MIVRGIVALCCLLLATVDGFSQWELVSSESIQELPAASSFVNAEVGNNGSAARVVGVMVDDRKVEFIVVDNPVAGTGRLDEAMDANQLFAGVNGGYFHPDFTPIGLEIVDGRQIHAFERAKLLSGVFAVDGGHPRLLRSSAFEVSSKITQALQAGPFLIADGKVVAGLNATKRARRTVIGFDGKNRWLLLLISPVTLADAAEILRVDGLVEGFKIKAALNLDGGSSSALWANTQPKPFYFREFGNVRNYLGVRAK